MKLNGIQMGWEDVKAHGGDAAGGQERERQIEAGCS